MTTEVKRPVDCTDAEVAAFCCLVRQGGEVESQGLEARVRLARALIFAYVDGMLVGVAALKQPAGSYRDGAFRSAGVPNDAAAFDFELGWVFVPPEHRGRRYSHVVAEAAMNQANGARIFATSRSDNAPMHKTLEHLGFERVGGSWKSTRGNYELVLYVTPPNRRLQPTAAPRR